MGGRQGAAWGGVGRRKQLPMVLWTIMETFWSRGALYLGAWARFHGHRIIGNCDQWEFLPHISASGAASGPCPHSQFSGDCQWCLDSRCVCELQAWHTHSLTPSLWVSSAESCDLQTFPLVNKVCSGPLCYIIDDNSMQEHLPLASFQWELGQHWSGTS